MFKKTFIPAAIGILNRIFYKSVMCTNPQNEFLCAFTSVKCSLNAYRPYKRVLNLPQPSQDGLLQVAGEQSNDLKCTKYMLSAKPESYVQLL